MEKIMMLFMVMVAMVAFQSCAPKEAPAEWEMIWNDEFDTNGAPDPAKWKFAGRGKADWNRFCYDDLKNAYVEDGRLFLVGTLSDDPADTAQFHTGALRTQGLFAFKYGKVEISAKLGQGQGSWPALWMMPEANVYGGWPVSGEIDIMEHLNFDTILYQTLHTDYTYNRKIKTNPKSSVTSGFNVGEFNVFGLEWYPDSLCFFVNGVKTLTYPRLEAEGSSQWPYDQEFHLIVNQALGGNWPGPVDPAHLPIHMEVDWVRVYKK